MRCKDCGDLADPKYTIKAAEYDMGGYPDLYFCKPCGQRAKALSDALLNALSSGKVTVEQVSKEISKYEPN